MCMEQGQTPFCLSLLTLGFKDQIPPSSATSQEYEGVASGTGGRHTLGTLLNLTALL